MSLRRKIYLPTGAALLVAMVAVFLTSQIFLMRGFTDIEATEMREQVKLAQAGVTENLADLSVTVRKLSSWDDTVAFLQGADENYIGTNFSDSFFVESNTNVAVIARDDGSIAWGRGFDLFNSKASSLPDGLGEYLKPESFLVKHSGLDSKLSGILTLPEGPMLIDSQPILTSDGAGPVRGAFIMGRWLDDSILAKLENQTGVSLALLPVSEAWLPSKVQDAVASVTSGGGTIVSPLNNKTLAGYAGLNDVFGQRTLVLQVLMPREFYARGVSSVRYFMISLVCVLFVFGLIVNRLLERSVFRKLASMTAQVRHVRPGGGTFAPIAVSGSDELDLLAQTVNDGFSQLESTRTRQEEQAWNLAQALEELKDRHVDLEKAHRNLQRLQQVSTSLGSSLEIKDALARLDGVALDIFEADEVWLLRLQADQQSLAGLGAFFRQKPGHALLPRLFRCEHPDAGLPQEANGLLRGLFRDPEAIFIDSVATLRPDERSRLFGSERPDLGGFKSFALVPLVAEDVAVGLAISAAKREHEFTPERRSTILLFAGQVAQALKNTRLVEEIRALGEIDSLSGLYNRRRALEQLALEVQRANRYQGTFSLLIADIDNFKLFNDTYGHPVGDEIIKRVAGILRYAGRSSDFVGRFGGDEFIVILPETYRARAKTVADHLRAALSLEPYVAPDGVSIPLRMSFGAASFPEDGQDAAALIAIADANLYESKRWGGDIVTVRSEPVSGEAVDSRAFNTLDSLVSAVDNKDHYTRRHSAQVARQTAVIGQALGLSSVQREALRVAALLHDVGKIGVPDRILRKPGALDPEEAGYMKQHALIGGTMISQHLPSHTQVREAVTSHHECWDGTGYPARLQGADIPLLGRILAVADAYSAMTTDRPYRAALTVNEALGRLAKGSGTQFDPEVVDAFVACLAPQAAGS